MELAEKLVKKAATECSVCNEALTEVVKKRVERGEDVNAVCKDLAQAIAIEAGGQVFSSEALRNRFKREEAKKIGRNDQPQKSEKTVGNESYDENAEPIKIDDVFLKCNLNSANEDPSTMTEREINAKKVIHKAEIAVEITDAIIRNNMINDVKKMAEDVPQLDLADEINEALDAAVYAINLAIKVNNLLGAVNEHLVVEKVELIYNNANGNSYKGE
jgi:hypothetical protein